MQFVPFLWLYIGWCKFHLLIIPSFAHVFPAISPPSQAQWWPGSDRERGVEAQVEMLRVWLRSLYDIYTSILWMYVYNQIYNMYMRMYACMHVCMYVCMYVNIYCMYIYIIHLYTYTLIHPSIHPSIHPYIHTYIHRDISQNGESPKPWVSVRKLSNFGWFGVFLF